MINIVDLDRESLHAALPYSHMMSLSYLHAHVKISIQPLFKSTK